MTDNDGIFPAFPQHPEQFTQTASGLTKREYFAGLAMQGLLAYVGDDVRRINMEIAASSVRLADCLILELAKEKA